MIRPLDLAVGLMCSAGAALAFYLPHADPPVRAPEAPCVAVTLAPIHSGGSTLNAAERAVPGPLVVPCR